VESPLKLNPANKLYKKLFYAFVFFFILSAYIFFLSRPIDLTISDLGRHLKNGELFAKYFCIPSVNLYSYTYPGFPFINHHWASGVIFYLVKTIFGFGGLSIFFIALNLLTFLLFFRIAWRYSSFEIAALAAFFAIPNLISRPEIRPEVFSYFFSGLFFWVLWNCKNGCLNRRWLLLLPLLEIFWVNLHVYFFIGLALIFLFLFEYSIDLFLYKNKEAGGPFKRLMVIFGVSIFAVFINPFGVSGASYPFNIFKNYNLALFENQSVFALVESMKARAIDFQPLFYFKLAFGLLVLSWIIVSIKIIRKKAEFSLTLFLISIFFSLMAFLALRNFAIFAYFALSVTAINLGYAINKKFSSGRDYLVISLLFILICVNLVLAKPSYWMRGSGFGIGLKKGNSSAMDFFRKERISGPVLNNYDIGSYLVYHLYPEYRVFIDNRPEAYPEDFLKGTYVALQQDENVWKKVSSLYGFNVILFYPHVNTPWGQGFLMRRILDPLWAAVYIDESCIILLKRKGPNQATIDKYALPVEIFLPEKEE